MRAVEIPALYVLLATALFHLRRHGRRGCASQPVAARQTFRAGDH